MLVYYSYFSKKCIEKKDWLLCNWLVIVGNSLCLTGFCSLQFVQKIKWLKREETTPICLFLIYLDLYTLV